MGGAAHVEVVTRDHEGRPDLSPHFLRGLRDDLELLPLVILGERLAFHSRGENRTGAERGDLARPQGYRSPQPA